MTAITPTTPTTPTTSTTPSLKDTINLDSLDARLVQYHYSIQKIIKIIVIIKELIKKCTTDNKIPISKYIIVLNGSIFNVNDNIYRRSEILTNGNKFNPVQSIEPQVTTSAISFDCMDNSTNYDTTKIQYPDFKKSLDTLKLLELLLINTYEIYNHKLKLGLSERMSLKESELQLDVELKGLIEFPELQSIEFLICDKLTVPLNTNEKTKSSLRKLDLISLKLNINNFTKCLEKLKLNNELLVDDYHKNSGNLKKKNYLLHKLLILLIHFADLYGVVRKFGKIIYLNNSFYFEDYSRADDTLKAILKNLDVYFNQSKKNNLMLAMITRMTRQNSVFNMNPNNVLEIHKICNDSYNLLSTMILVLKKLETEWQNIIDSNRANEFDKDLLREKIKQQTIKERSDLKQQNIKESAVINRRLEAQYVPAEKTKLMQERQARLQKSVSDLAKEDRLIKEAEAREKDSLKAEDIQAKVEERERQLRDELKASEVDNDPNRSSSSSASSNSANQSMENLNGLMRRSSLRSSASGTLGRRESISKRNSMILPSSSSRENSPHLKKEMLNRRNSVHITPETRRILDFSDESITSSVNSGSSSPIPFPIPKSPASALAGAAAASVKNMNKSKLQMNVNNVNNNPVTAAALASKRAQQQPTQLSAQQRLQLHIMKSAQNGTAITKALERPKNRPIYVAQQDQQLQQQQLQSTSSQRTNSLQQAQQEPTSVIVSPQPRSRTNSIQGENDLSSFPSSPLNSLKQGSAQDLRSLQQLLPNNRSRSNSNQSMEYDNSSPSKNPRIRSRSNSASQKPSDNIINIHEHREIDAFDANNTNSNSDNSGDSGEINVLSVNNIPSNTNSNPSSRGSTSRTRSRSSSIKQGPYKPAGNLIVYPEDSTPPTDEVTGEIIKKVRFCGVGEYFEEEDAPTPQQIQKQLRQKWSSYKPQFRNRTKLLNTQEGLAFRKFQHSADQVGGSGWSGEFEGFSRNHQNAIPVDANGKFSMMSVVSGNNNSNSNWDQGQKRLSKLFKRR